MFFMNHEIEPSSMNESIKSPMKETKPLTVIVVEPEYQSFFQIIENQVQLLIQALMIENLIPEFRTTFGIQIKPFGAYRLKILEIVSILIKITKPFNFLTIFCKNKIFCLIMVWFLFDIHLKF